MLRVLFPWSVAVLPHLFWFLLGFTSIICRWLLPLICLGLALLLLALAIIILKLLYTVHKSSESWLSAVAVATVGTVRRQVGHLLDKALRRTFGSSSRQLVQLQAHLPSDEPAGSSSRQLVFSCWHLPCDEPAGSSSRQLIFSCWHCLATNLRVRVRGSWGQLQAHNA